MTCWEGKEGHGLDFEHMQVAVLVLDQAAGAGGAGLVALLMMTGSKIKR